jgi:phosphatidylserine/phosphatidylglycerophosphate/cardiolipin synthase-like enzyme
MILEQLVTAGTITEFEIWKLRRHYSRILQKYQASAEEEVELAIGSPGKLRIGYFKQERHWQPGKPVKSHLKCVIVDEKITVLGSGNMDRASWYTSQELGVAFLSAEVARDVRECINEGLAGRVEYIC